MAPRRNPPGPSPTVDELGEIASCRSSDEDRVIAALAALWADWRAG